MLIIKKHCISLLKQNETNTKYYERAIKNFVNRAKKLII